MRKEGAGGGNSHRLPSATARTPSCRSMDLGSSDLLDVFLEPPEDIFSAGSFLELGFTCSPPEVPGTRLREQGRRGWEPSGGRGCVSVVDGRGEGVKYASDEESPLERSLRTEIPK